MVQLKVEKRIFDDFYILTIPSVSIIAFFRKGENISELLI